MAIDSFKEPPVKVSPGEDKDLLEPRYGATQRGGYPLFKAFATWDKSLKKAECAANIQGFGGIGADALIGTRVEVDGNPSRDMELRIDPNWKGVISNKGDASSSLRFQSLVVRDSGLNFPEIGSSDILDRREHDFLDAGTDLTPQYLKGSADTTLEVQASDMSDGDVLNVSVAAETNASVSGGVAQGRSDAATNNDSNYDGRIFYGSIRVRWD